MTGPLWLAPLLAVVMLLIAAGSGARLVLWWLRGRAAEPEADALHLLMGVAMAAMLEPRLSPIPGTAWLVLFAVASAWFAARAIRPLGQHAAGGPRPGSSRWECVHPAPHAVESAAMVYMLTPARGAGHVPAIAMPGMAGAAGAANPAVALVLAMFLLGYIVWMTDRMASQSRDRIGERGPRRARDAGPNADKTGIAQAAGSSLAPRAAACSKIAMSLAMGYMLLSML